MPTLFDRYQDPNLTSIWAQVGVTNFFSDEKSIGFTTNQNLQDPQTQFISIAGQTSYDISDNSSIRLSVGGITWPGPTFGTGQISGRHGGTAGSPESIPPTPPHDIEHSVLDTNAGVNSSQIGGRHGGTDGAPESIPPTPSHDIEHSLYDVGAGTNLSQISGRHGGTDGAPTNIPPVPPHDIEHTELDIGAGENLSQISGRHGGTEGAPENIPSIPPHDIEHSIYDNGAGINSSQISGRHGGTEGAPVSIPPTPPHDVEHSELNIGAGINLSQIGGRHYEGTIPFDQRPNTMAMDIMTPGERLGGVDVNRVQPVYTPISQILGDPDALF